MNRISRLEDIQRWVRWVHPPKWKVLLNVAFPNGLGRMLCHVAPEPAMPWASCNLCSPAAPPHVVTKSKPWLSLPQGACSATFPAPYYFDILEFCSRHFPQSSMCIVVSVPKKSQTTNNWKWLKMACSRQVCRNSIHFFIVCPDSSLVLAKLFPEVRLKRCLDCSWRLQWWVVMHVSRGATSKRMPTISPAPKNCQGCYRLSQAILLPSSMIPTPICHCWPKFQVQT